MAETYNSRNVQNPPTNALTQIKEIHKMGFRKGSISFNPPNRAKTPGLLSSVLSPQHQSPSNQWQKNEFEFYKTQGKK